MNSVTNKTKQTRIPGIMGGMGPQATVNFMAKLLEQTDASSDQDHLRLLVDHNPTVPNRHAAINGTGEDAGPHLAQMAVGLEASGADFIVMVCNTAHAFQSAIEESISVPFYSIIDEVVKELLNHYPEKSNIGLMAADGCLDTGLYQNALRAAGFNIVEWNARQRTQFMDVVYQIKAGDLSATVSEKMHELAQQLVNGGAEVLVSGCTEIPLVLNARSLGKPLLCSTDTLIKRVIEYSLKEN